MYLKNRPIARGFSRGEQKFFSISFIRDTIVRLPLGDGAARVVLYLRSLESGREDNNKEDE